ncbi:MAG: penicillin acylase family protein [Solirubrobacterales bacterium]|nr:penicillin acylase family protein [Solirubrobacterales bacterium]
MPRPTLPLAVAALLALAAPAHAKDYAGTALNVIPSGQRGDVPAKPGADDQAKLYDALTPVADQVTLPDLTKYFKPAVLGTGGDQCPCRTESVPRKGVKIVRDRFNVPHVTGRNRDDLTWASGWILAQDRALLLAVGRYPARMAAINAPNTSAFSLVTGVKPVTPSQQTERFIAKQTDVLQRTKEGRDLLHDVDVYVDGVNDRLKRDKSKEKPFGRNDVYAVNALVGQIFGEGGGDEARRSMVLDALTKRLGAAAGASVWNDLTEHADPAHASTIDKTFNALPIPSRASGNQVLDDGSLKRVTSANDLAGQSRAAIAKATKRPQHASNFLMVSARRSTNGHPLFVGGPQIGYFYPGLTFELDLKAPGIEARGASAPGFPGNILIGRGQDNVWTLTSAGSDLIDEYVETLCGGSRFKYLYKRKCRSMGTFDAGTVNGKRFRFRTTVHGPVVAYATVKGKPVAVSRKRASTGMDVLFQLPFRDMTLGKVRNAKQFLSSFAKSPFTFNAGYADDRNVAMYSAGRLPKRDNRVDPRLPTDGSGNYEWRGFLSAGQHPQQIDTNDGTMVNWNNRPAPGWGAADDNWTYSPVHRVEMLEANLARSEKHDLASVVGAMNSAATQDLRVLQVLPVVEEVLRGGPAPSAREERMLALIDQWRDNGAHWLDRDGDGKTDAQGAAITDALYPKVVDAVLGPVLGPQLPTVERFIGREASTEDDFTGGAMGHVEKDLRTVLGKPVQQPFSTRYCGDGDLTACRDALWAAVKAAGDDLAAANGGSQDPDTWFTPARTITSAPIGAWTIRYTNRPSGIQQVMTFTGHRPAK